jgi:transcriptional regulator with XRE-family HTH domain
MLFVMDKIRFGEWIAREREKRGWSQADLARYAGLHRQSLYKIENGEASPAVETFIALATALDISPNVLFRKAGLLPPIDENDAWADDMTNRMSKLTGARRSIAEKLVQSLIEEEQKENAPTPARKLARA